MSIDDAPVQLLTTFAGVERELVSLERVDDAYSALTRLAVERIDGTEYAGVTVGRGRSFITRGATADLVGRVDSIQYRLLSGPCLDAAVHDRVYRAEDPRTDNRWPAFGEGAARLGVLSMMAIRLFLPDDDRVASLNVYATETGAFTEASEVTGMLLANLGALTVAGTTARDRATHLAKALDSNREIGMAMGILIAQFKLTRDQAFDVLRITSQDTNRKIVELAAEVVNTGKLELPPRLRHS
ncbi:MAG: hypothetical protein JWM76_2871 [Pseudonocardiales bacterium]|nr:hypothetical protein [Pseudonocardiales bacterium]